MGRRSTVSVSTVAGHDRGNLSTNVDKKGTGLTRAWWALQNVHKLWCSKWFWKMRSAKCVPDCSESSISMSKLKKMRGSEHFWKMKLVLVKCPRESNETVARVRFALQYAQESGDRSTFDGWGWQISLVDCLVYWFNDSLVYDLIHLYLQLQWYFITANDFERARSCQTYVSYWGTFMFLHVCPFLLMVEVDPYSAASQQRSWGLGCAFLPCQLGVLLWSKSWSIDSDGRSTRRFRTCFSNAFSHENCRNEIVGVPYARILSSSHLYMIWWVPLPQADCWEGSPRQNIVISNS